MTSKAYKKELMDRFSNSIEQEVEDLKDEYETDYMEAILIYCEEKSIDERDIASIIPDTIKVKLEIECIDKRLVKGKKPQSLEEFFE